MSGVEWSALLCGDSGVVCECVAGGHRTNGHSMGGRRAAVCLSVCLSLRSQRPETPDERKGKETKQNKKKERERDTQTVRPVRRWQGSAMQCGAVRCGAMQWGSDVAADEVTVKTLAVWMNATATLPVGPGACTQRTVRCVCVCVLHQLVHRALTRAIMLPVRIARSATSLRSKSTRTAIAAASTRLHARAATASLHSSAMSHVAATVPAQAATPAASAAPVTGASGPSPTSSLVNGGLASFPSPRHMLAHMLDLTSRFALIRNYVGVVEDMSEEAIVVETELFPKGQCARSTEAQGDRAVE